MQPSPQIPRDRRRLALVVLALGLLWPVAREVARIFQERRAPQVAPAEPAPATEPSGRNAP